MSPHPKSSLVDVFFSYSHRDEKLREALGTHLALLKRQGAIRTWHDRKIDPGREWEGEIDAHLETADLILLLISPDFINSDYCFDREMKLALQRHEEGEARVVPIILRPTDWKTAEFARLQALPKDGRPITKWSDTDEAFLDVVQGLRKVIENLRPAAPDYPDPQTRDRSLSLEQAYERRAELEANGKSTRATDETIVDLKRQLREDGHLKEGDFLLDGRFRLQKLIGQGGFAQVWKAFDRDRRTLVAVKVLHTQYGRDKSRRERFFRGARQMARMHDHLGIVRVLEEKCGDGGYHFFVMEYVGGGDFHQAVHSSQMAPAERLKVVLEIGEVLRVAHKRRIVHRDVKPANILLDIDGRPKLTDFDLVRAADTTGGTRTSMLGTFLYAAPEAMADGKQAAEPADVYGLGMTALFALHGDDLPPVVLRKLPEFLASLNVDETTRRVLERAVEWEVEDRWRLIGEFCDALREELTQVELVGSVVEATLDVQVAESVQKRLNEKDGSELVYVPGGTYVLGADDIDVNSRPVHKVELSPFWIGKYPVTNEQYGRFLEATGRQEPAYWTEYRFKGPFLPVVGVTWEDASEYCNWAGLKLPSEAQWEAAARGSDSRRYPWGDDEPSSELADFGRKFSSDKPDAVGSHPLGVGPYGTQDQAGGVWEWCEDLWNSSAYVDRDGTCDPVEMSSDVAARIVRGGSWAAEARFLPAAFRYGHRAGSRRVSFGFRVCLSGPEP